MPKHYIMLRNYCNKIIEHSDARKLPPAAPHYFKELNYYAISAGSIREKIAKKYASTFPKVKLLSIDEIAGGWTKAQKTHFSDGGIFDEIYQVH